MGRGSREIPPPFFNNKPRTGMEEQIRELVAALTPISDMAVLLGMNERDLREAIDDYANPISVAYRKAKAEVALEMRKATIALANEGDKDAAEAVANFYFTTLRDE